MKKERSQNRRLIITKNLIMMLVVVVVGMMAVWSWFVVNKQVKASNITITSAYPNEIGFAPVLKYYNDDGTFTEGPGIFSDTISFSGAQLTKDCTGDGETLLVPDFSVIKDRNEANEIGRKVYISGPWEEALSQVDVEDIKRNNPDANVEARYLEFEFYARSSTKTIRLMPGSYLRGESEASNTNAMTTGYSIDKKSAYGDFNVDGLVGAMRVAFLAQGVTNVTQYIENRVIKENGNPNNAHGTTATFDNTNKPRQLTGLWLPRPDVRLNTTTSTTDWTLTTHIGRNTTTDTPETNPTYFHKFFAPANDTSNNVTYPIKYRKDTGLTQGTTLVPTSGTKTLSKKTGTGVEEITATANDQKFIVSDPGPSGSYATLGKEAAITGLTYSDDLNQIRLVRDANGIVTEESNKDNYFVYKYTMRIWIEGNDTEARRAMDGGAFDLHLEVR